MFWRVKIQPCPSSTNRAAARPGHRAVAHSGGQLAHLLGPAVPGHKDAGEAGAAVLTGAEIALLVQLQLSPEGGGAGDPPHGGEHPVQGELQGLSGGGLADPQTGEPALRLEQGLRCIAQQQADIVPGPYPLRQLWTARNSSRRWIRVTRRHTPERNRASCRAVSPPPTMAVSRP